MTKTKTHEADAGATGAKGDDKGGGDTGSTGPTGATGDAGHDPRAKPLADDGRTYVRDVDEYARHDRGDGVRRHRHAAPPSEPKRSLPREATPLPDGAKRPSFHHLTLWLDDMCKVIMAGGQPNRDHARVIHEEIDAGRTHLADGPFGG